MVTRVYAGDDEVYVPDLARWVAPGDEVDFDDGAPDSSVWLTPAAAKKAKPSKKVDVVDPEPSTDHVVTEES